MFMSEIEDLTEDKYRSMVLSGKNSRDICSDIGVSTTTLYAYLRENRWPLPTELRRQNGLAAHAKVRTSVHPKTAFRKSKVDEFVQRMPVKEYIERSMNGETVNTMAQELNIARPSLYSYIRQLGWKMPRVIRQEAGIKSRHPGRKQVEGRFERDAQMLAMKVMGTPFAEIGKRFGLTEEGARVAILKHEARLLAKHRKEITFKPHAKTTGRKPQWHHSQKIKLTHSKYLKLAPTHSVEDFAKMFDVTYHAFISFLTRMKWETPKVIQLAERKRRIDDMMAEGYTPKQIRRSLGLSQQNWSQFMKGQQNDLADPA